MIILDGNNIGARAFFATHYKKPSFNPHTFSSAFVKSMLNVLRMAMLRYGNSQAVLCMDSRAQWRKDIYPEYKEDRNTEDGQHSRCSCRNFGFNF